MNNATEPVDGRQGIGRPRDDEAEQRVIDAALEEYAEGGGAAFSIYGVARRARVGKSMIYLRWSDKNALLNDAVARRSQRVADIDEGDFREDLTMFALRFHRHLQSSIGWATLRIAVDATRAPDLLDNFLRDVVSQHRDAIERIVDGAIARGELRTDARSQVDTLMELIYGVVIAQSLRLPHGDEPLDERVLTAMIGPAVHLIIAGMSSFAPGEARRV